MGRRAGPLVATRYWTAASDRRTVRVNPGVEFPAWIQLGRRQIMSGTVENATRDSVVTSRREPGHAPFHEQYSISCHQDGRASSRCHRLPLGPECGTSW